MKLWHCVAIAVVAYLIGVKFPGIGQKAFSTIGM